MSLTLKAFANFSPVLRFGNPGKTNPNIFDDATLKGLRHRSPNQQSLPTPSELRRNNVPFLTPGLQSKPWA